MNYNSSLIIKYRFYFEKGDYKEAYDVLNQIEKEYKNINSFKIFVNSEKVKLRNHSPKKDTNQIPVITYNAYFKNELELYLIQIKGF